MGPWNNEPNSSNMPAWIVPVAMAAASLIGNALSNRAAKKQQAAQNAYNKSESELAYQRSLELQKYNEPMNQMARFGEAGLNPNLIYGQSNQGSASYQANRSVPRAYFNPMSQLPEAIGMYQQVAMRSAQIDNVKAATEEKRANIINKGLMSGLMKIKGQREEHALHREPDVSAIMNNKAQASEATLLQEWQKLKLMQQKEQLNVLDQSSKALGIDAKHQQMESVAADILFKRFRNQWMSQGVTSSDNPLLRIFVRMLTESGLDFGDIGGAASDHFDKARKDIAPQLDSLERLKQDLMDKRPGKFRYENRFNKHRLTPW